MKKKNNKDATCVEMERIKEKEEDKLIKKIKTPHGSNWKG